MVENAIFLQNYDINFKTHTMVLFSFCIMHLYVKSYKFDCTLADHPMNSLNSVKTQAWHDFLLCIFHHVVTPKRIKQIPCLFWHKLTYYLTHLNWQPSNTLDDVHHGNPCVAIEQHNITQVVFIMLTVLNWFYILFLNMHLYHTTTRRTLLFVLHYLSQHTLWHDKLLLTILFIVFPWIGNTHV